MFCRLLWYVGLCLVNVSQLASADGDCETSTPQCRQPISSSNSSPATVTNESITTIDKVDYVLSASSAVLDDRATPLPTLANGHLGFTVLEDAVYMAGLYNGAGGLSHRARVPNMANIRPENGCYTGTDPSCNVSLDLHGGLFRVDYMGTSGSYRMTHLLYPHALFRRLVVNQFLIERLAPDTGDISVKLMPLEAFTSEDIQFDPIRTLRVDRHGPPRGTGWNRVYQSCGRTLEVENRTYQPETRSVCVLWNHVPERLIMARSERALEFRFMMAVDENSDVARRELTTALLQPDEDLRRAHTSLWGSFWDRFDVLTAGNGPLQRAIRTSVFYLISSLPFEVSYVRSPGPFWGLSPTGLGRGGSNLDDYEGHSFWDTEIWMFPVLNLIDPWYSKLLIEYRTRMLPVAKDLAREGGYEGARFPWESGYTGVEVTQPCCPEVAKFQHHITGDISFAWRQYLGTTQDLEWLRVHGGCRVIQEIADFWTSRLAFNHTGSGQYDIVAVMGPDEDHENVTNNAYTNVIAGYALYFGEFVSCVCGDDVSARNWSIIASRVKLPYDPERDYHPQYDGYQPGTIIKQADAILLGYPLQYGRMRPATRRNDLRAYEPVTRSTGPAMTWAMHAVNHLDVGDYDLAATNFHRSYQPYIRGPFCVWHELEQVGTGAKNFLTGAGGFLQTVLFGYAGIRVHLDHLEVQGTGVLSGRIPPASEGITVRGIYYLGAFVTVTRNTNASHVVVAHLEAALTIGFDDENAPMDVVPNQQYHLNNRTALIRPKTFPYQDCDLPRDVIGE